MSETRVVHVNDRVPGSVYIGRANGRMRLKASPFANPFRVDEWGRQQAIQEYRELLDWRLRNGRTVDELIAMRGKPLACWCRHDDEPKTDDNACHGDVLVSLLERYTDDELREMAR